MLPDNNNTIESQAGPTIPGPYIAPQQTETWPLKPKEIKSWDKCLNIESSLKTVIVILFGTAGVVTISLLAQLHALYSTGSGVGGAVATDNSICTGIGNSILQQSGSAVDAAIAAVFCLSVVHFHATGLGGGGVLLSYNERKRAVSNVLDFQVTSPAVTSDVPVGIPGVVAGLWEAHQLHGRLPWPSLVAPSTALARFGFPVSDSLLKAAACVSLNNQTTPLSKLLGTLKLDLNLKMPKLADTLQLIAEIGPHVFYNGTIADEIIYTVKVASGSIQMQDLVNYRIKQGVSEKTTFDKFDITVPASSFAGSFLLDSLDTIQALDLQPEESLTGDTVRKLSDVLYDTLKNLLMKEEGGGPAGEGRHSTVVTAVDADHSIVSIVTGLNSLFGSQLMTEAGFVLNDFVHNGRIQSVGTPVLVQQTGQLCGRRIITGAGDVTALVQVITQMITFSQSTNSSIEAPRFLLGPVPRSILLEGDYAIL